MPVSNRDHPLLVGPVRCRRAVVPVGHRGPAEGAPVRVQLGDQHHQGIEAAPRQQPPGKKQPSTLEGCELIPGAGFGCLVWKGHRAEDEGPAPFPQQGARIPDRAPPGAG